MTETDSSSSITALLERIAIALEQSAPQGASRADLQAANCFVFAPPEGLDPVPAVSHVPLPLLRGIDNASQTLLDNTRRFARNLPANNALLWGARGMGKSSLIKAVHAQILQEMPEQPPLKLIEIAREDIAYLPQLMRILRRSAFPCLLFCDDLSFDNGDANYKSLKAVLEGGVEGRPSNVLFYATSNRRHLLPREMVENERSTAIHPGEAVEEKVSLSDRFGLWLGFHHCSQDEYLAIVDGYAEAYNLPIEKVDLHRQALQWAAGRGNRSGRVANQFIQDLAGRLEQPIPMA